MVEVARKLANIQAGSGNGLCPIGPANRRRDLHALNLERVQAESRAHSLEEDIDFLKQKWDNERRELEKQAFQDPATESREFWKSEVQQMLKELYDDFDNELENIKDELSNAHSVKVCGCGPNSYRPFSISFVFIRTALLL